MEGWMLEMSLKEAVGLTSLLTLLQLKTKRFLLKSFITFWKQWFSKKKNHAPQSIKASFETEEQKLT